MIAFLRIPSTNYNHAFHLLVIHFVYDLPIAGVMPWRCLGVDAESSLCPVLGGVQPGRPGAGTQDHYFTTSDGGSVSTKFDFTVYFSFFFYRLSGNNDALLTRPQWLQGLQWSGPSTWLCLTTPRPRHTLPLCQ